mmetsp:Transcript_5865/g.7077  ORF Transcript_5865/g.7077 Transcript_5865/m.7077 type:complete len:204 (-) Transcript_5865:83-694(-)
MLTGSRKQAGWVTPVWVLFVTLTSIVGILAVIRIIALSMHSSWRSDLNGAFPEKCGSWAESDGCTRITLRQASCIRDKDISSENNIVINTVNDKQLNRVIAGCVDDLSGAKLNSPDDYSDSSQSGQTVHVTVNSLFFGFIDDLYIVQEPYDAGVSGEQRVLRLQSQLRMGKSDFEQNYNHVKTILDCIDDELTTFNNPRPCSL